MEAITVTGLIIAGIVGMFKEDKPKAKQPRTKAAAAPIHTVTAYGSNIMPPSMQR